MESTIICLDNSEWTRNGDYTPNRFQAQADAVNLLAGAKTEANPENTVGVLTMAGKTPRILVTPTTDLGKILNSMQVTLVTARDSIVTFNNLQCQVNLVLGTASANQLCTELPESFRSQPSSISSHRAWR